MIAVPLAVDRRHPVPVPPPGDPPNLRPLSLCPPYRPASPPNHSPIPFAEAGRGVQEYRRKLTHGATWRKPPQTEPPLYCDSRRVTKTEALIKISTRHPSVRTVGNATADPPPPHAGGLQVEATLQLFPLLIEVISSCDFAAPLSSASSQFSSSAPASSSSTLPSCNPLLFLI